MRDSKSESKRAEGRTVVVSAVNLVEGGTLSILRECLTTLRRDLPPQWRIVALVHDRALAPADGVEYLEFPALKASWLRRAWFEYWSCRKLSRGLRADLWLALHDLTPVVTARRQVVYCHNPMPFYRITWRESWLAPKQLVFTLFYGVMYRLFIRRNHAIIVQQDWLRDEFRRRYGVREVIVSRPVPAAPAAPARAPSAAPLFIYPTLPRIFKNLEVVGEAVRLLEADPRWKGRVKLTVAGDENAYAREIHERFKDLRTLEFIGLQSREQMSALYAEADCLLFPSRLETWGLPLTEAQGHGLAILAADLPYAHETVGSYARAAYFQPRDASKLARQMLELQERRLVFEPAVLPHVAAPYAPDWPSLIRLLVAGL